MTALAPILQGFFTDKLMRQRRAGPNTIAAYRDTWRLLLQFAYHTTRTAPSGLDLAQLDTALVTAFLDHLETERANSITTRNARLAAIRSLFRYAALHAPEHADTIARVLAIPPKRCDRPLVCFLTAAEIDALLAAPDRSTWLGRRDHALLLLAYQTGLRVCELIGLARNDIHLGTGAHVRCHGKGRKDRATPLTRQTVAALQVWLTDHPGGPDDPVFITREGRRLSRDAVAKLVTKHATRAATHSSTLAAKNITPHTLRHSAAMALLHAGVDTSVIALWLGCAARRSVVSPAQRAEMRGDISGSDGYTWTRKGKGTVACQETGSHAQAYGVACREIRVIWRKLDCLNPNLQKVKMSRPPERRLKPVPVPAAGCPSACGNPLGAGAMPCPGIEGDEWGA